MSKVALITGASQGLGSVLSTFLAGQGYDLVIAARAAGPLQAKAASLSGFGIKVTPVAGDLADDACLQQVIGAARALGGLNLLINNASELGPLPLPELADYPVAALERVFRVNTLAPLILVQKALPLLKASGGLVINVSSDAAVGGYPEWGGYGASKAALDLISLTLANELREAGVGVVSVDPGDMRTRMAAQAFGDDIEDRPLPDVTLPFWAWLLGHRPLEVSGGRYEAQAETWELPA